MNHSSWEARGIKASTAAMRIRVFGVSFPDQVDHAEPEGYRKGSVAEKTGHYVSYQPVALKSGNERLNLGVHVF